MSRLSYAVVIDDNHFDETSAIAETISRQGFKVDRVLPEIGAIYGSAEEALVGRLRDIAGVEEVRESRDIQMPPFREGIPQ
ncbi:hypothetical protein [Rhizobium sp. 18055]|uniref:hypothetical protein n=1 Tax=Rhizobium sp. 18055 TaxID=2681403 RepID=UPI00135A76F0|nr:hypothetical protein [Rhizobium sp. 18055]